MSKNTRFTHIGGGVVTELNTPSSAKSSQKNIFKPLIASSLALALGVSVASATNPTITNGTSAITLPQNFTLSPNSDGYDIFSYDGNQLTNLMIWIGNGSINYNPSNDSGDPELQLNSDVTLTSTNGISMGEGGTLQISSWVGSGTRTFTLNLNSITSGHYAIQGSLSLEGNTNILNLGGLGISENLILKSGTNNLTFSSSATIGGDITIYNGTNTLDFANGNYGTSSNKRTISVYGGTTEFRNLTTLYGNIIRLAEDNRDGTITFSTKTNVIGNITRSGNLGSPNVGSLIINFQAGSTFDGNIQTGTTSSGNDYSSNTITFSGTSNATDVVLNGSIISYGTGNMEALNESNGNHITFTQGSMTGNITASGKYARVGYNEIEFQQAGAQLTGNITAELGADSFFGYGVNKITFSAGGTYSGNILAKGLAFQSGNQIFGTNTLIFSAGTSILSGSIRAEWYNGAQNSRAKNNITMSGTSNTISASITSAGGINTIAITNGTSNISGDISVEAGGTNSITFSGTGAYSVSGSLTSSGGSNTIAFINPTSADGTPSQDLVDGSFSGGITTNGGINEISASKILTLNNGGATEKIYKVTSGTTQITAQTLSANNITLSSTGGRNILNATSLNTASFNSIQATGGTNTIETTGAGDLAFTRGLSSVSYGSDKRGNTITLANGNLTIGKFDSNVVNAVYGDTTGKSLYAWNGNNSNTITLNKNGAILTLGGDIASGGGTSAYPTYNTINFNGTSGILKSGSGDSISSSGTTNINIQALEIKNSSDTTGTLATTSGTTTLTFKDSVAGSLSGNISTSEGNTNIVLQDGQSYSFNGTLSTSNGGRNNLDLSSKSATITTDLALSGNDSVTANSGNIITIGGSQTLTLLDSSSHKKTITTSGGRTYINFGGGDSTLSGNVATSAGNTTFKFSTDNANYAIDGTLSTSNAGRNNIDLSSKSATITTDLTLSGDSSVTETNGNIITIGTDKTLTLNGSSQVKTIATSGGRTYLNFSGNNSTLSGNVATSGGITTINVGNDSNGASAFIGGVVNGNGTSNIVFGSGGDARSLTLKGDGNTITSIDANNAGTLTLGDGTHKADTAVSGIVGENLAVIYGATEASNLTLKGDGNTIASIDASEEGTLSLGNGSTKADTVVSSLTGENLSVVYGSTVASNLTLEGANNTITSIDASNAGKLTLGKTGSAVNADVKAITDGNNLDVAFITDEANTLTLNDATSKLKSIDTTSGSGTINLVSSVTSLTVGTAPTAISVGTDNTLNFTIADRTNALNLKNGIDATNGSSLITINDTGSNAVIAEGALTNVDVKFVGDTSSALTLYGTTNTLKSVNATIAGTLTLGNDSAKADAKIGALTGSNLSVAYGTGAVSNLTLEGATNTIALINATNEGTLSLGKAGSAVNADVKNITTGENLNVAFITDNTANALALNVTESKLKSIDTTSGSGTINLVSGVESLAVGSAPATAIDVGDSKTLNFVIFDRETDLNLVNGIDATDATSLITINDTGDKAVIVSGELTNVDVDFAGETSSALTLYGTTNILKSVDATNTSKLTLGDGTHKADVEIGTLTGDKLAVIYGAGTASNLTLKGDDNTIASIDANNAGKLTLDATNAGVTTTISSEIEGNNLTVQFKGSSSGASTLNLVGGTLDGIELTSGNVDENLLNLQSGNTTITNGVNVTSGGITISLGGSATLTSNLSNSADLDLTFTGNNILTGEIDTTTGTTNLNVRTGATATINGEVKGSGATQATLEANSTLNLVSNATLSKITMASSSVLDLSNPVGTHSDKNTSYSFDELNAGGANIVLYSEANKAKSRIDARGASASDKYYTLLKIGENGKGLVGDNTTFTLHLDNAKYDNVYLGGVAQTGTPNNGDQYGYTYADRIVIENGSGDSGKIADIKLKIVPKLDELGEISYQGGGTEKEGNIAVLTVKDGVTEKVESVQSVEVAGIQTQVNITSATTDITGDSSGSGYTTYFAGDAKAVSISEGVKEIASTALTVNYDLYLANFNSLNKRMGELRDNAHNQGVWARVYGGAMSNDFGAGSKTEYVTAQGGYDYSLTLGDARNYMGIAIAYGHSSTKSNQIQNAISNVGVGQATGLQDVNSNMVEVGIYNSYVMDSGWYNDTILKFDYIMSSFTMTDNPSLESETNNFAMILSNEFGYRYKFGSDASWYIDPQLEVGFGYFNQSDFNRVIFDHINQQSADIKATQDTILTLRGRAGLSLGKKFTTEKGFASLYVGAFYEYDYIEGGNANASSFGVVNTIDSIESNGRAIVNVGSNIELTEGVRMYIDVEKSFGDKQRTDMQFNFGARYSFGEATPTLSHHEQYKTISAPLKVDGLKDHKDDEESKNDTEESKNTEKEDSKSK